MSYSSIRLFLYLLSVLSGPVFAGSSPVTSKLYDISYLWHRDAVGVQDYRERVARVLGPGVEKDLKVVTNGDLFGLLYHRRGDSNGAVRVARAHSRLLRSKGLEEAAPVLSRDWVFLTDDGPGRVSVAEVIPAKPAAPAMSAETPRQVRDLETAVEAYIKRLRREGRIGSDERTGWSVYDFTTGQKLVTINEEVQFQAASLIKPFIAAAFFQRVEQGELKYGPRSRRHMERMIQRSDNRSTNWVMRQVGGPQAVQRILKRNYPGIFLATHVVEYIPSGGRTYRNKASAHDYSRFLYAIWKEKIPRAREIKRLMSLEGPDRIYTGAEALPPGTRVFNKTGSTARLCADMGILSVQGPDGKRYPYTLIGIIEKQNKAGNYSAWIRSRAEVIRDVSDIVYRGIARRHEFGDVL